MSARYEARPHPTSKVPRILAAWDRERKDWAREPGPDRLPLVFVSKTQLNLWAAKGDLVAAKDRVDQGDTGTN